MPANTDDADATISRLSPVPESQQLARILAARVARGDWARNHPIPSEERLAQEYGIARNTVRRGIRALVDEGVLFVVPRRGTYVA